MRTLLLSAVLYLTGIAIVLLIRPTLMFNADGTWKEFGTISKTHTIFPFWMFCIVWAAVSYFITHLAVGEHRSAVVKAQLLTGATSVLGSLHEAEPPEDLVYPLPPSKKKKAKKSAEPTSTAVKPGYYVLDAKQLAETGVPKYMYVGDDAPEDYTPPPSRGGVRRRALPPPESESESDSE